MSTPDEPDLRQRLVDIYDGARARAAELRKQLREAVQEVDGLRRSLAALGVDVVASESILTAGDQLRDEAFRVLSEADPYQRGMRVRELLEALEDEGFRVDGANPVNTVRNAIAGDLRFRVVARGVVTWSDPVDAFEDLLPKA